MAAASPTEFLVRPEKSPTTRGDVSVAASCPSAADVCLATAHVHESRRPPWDDLEVGEAARAEGAGPGILGAAGGGKRPLRQGIRGVWEWEPGSGAGAGKIAALGPMAVAAKAGAEEEMAR